MLFSVKYNIGNCFIMYFNKYSQRFAATKLFDKIYDYSVRSIIGKLPALSGGFIKDEYCS